MSRPAVSKHLRILRHAGLATETRDGRRRIYRLETGALATVSQWLSQMEAASPIPVPSRSPEPARKGTANAGRRRIRKSAPAAERRIGPVTEDLSAGSLAESPVESPSGSRSESPIEDDGSDWKSW